MPKQQTTQQFINEIRNGPNVQDRTRTLLNGWLEQVQQVQKQGPQAFEQWCAAQQSQITNYTTAIAGEQMTGGAGGGRAG